MLNIDSRKNQVTFNSPSIIFKDSECECNVLEINNESINFNSVINFTDNNNVIFSFNPKEKRALINGELFVSSNIIKSFRKISPKLNEKLTLDTEIILLKIDSDQSLTLELNKENFTVGTTRKIVVYNNINNVDINIMDLVKLRDINSGIELLFDGKKMDCNW